jgi:hypothetical protein
MVGRETTVKIVEDTLGEFLFLSHWHVPIAVNYLIGSYEALANCQFLPFVFIRMQDPASFVTGSRSHILAGHGVKP